MSTNYIKVWEYHNNRKLPDNMEIHHIDGNHHNNDPSNLLAVTIEEHLSIHLKQKDYGAVQAILLRINMTEEQKELLKFCASEHQKKLIAEGTHNFQKIDKKRKSEISRLAALKTVQLKIGIHSINSDPIKAKQNAKNARSKLSKEAEMKMMEAWKEKIKDSKWWINEEGKRKRSKIQPGINWKEGMKWK